MNHKVSRCLARHHNAGDYLLSRYEVVPDRVACVIDWCGPARLHNGGHLLFIHSVCPHLQIQPMLCFQFYVCVTGHGGAEAGVLVRDDSHIIMTLARWQLLAHISTGEKQHTLLFLITGLKPLFNKGS